MNKDFTIKLFVDNTIATNPKKKKRKLKQT